MSSAEYKWKHFPQSIYLYIPQRKFWEIKYNEMLECLEVRLGGLSEEDKEEKTQTNSLEPQLKEKALEYGELLINGKLRKGYKLREAKQNYLIQIIEPEEEKIDRNSNKESMNLEDKNQGQKGGKNNGLKRKGQGPLIRDDQKKMMKSVPLTSQEVFGNYDPKKEISFSSFSSDESARGSGEEEFKSLSHKFDKKNDVFLIDNNRFKGDYLIGPGDKKVQYTQIHVLDKFVKIENGIVDNPRVTDIQLEAYKTHDIAVAETKKTIADKLLKNFKSCPDIFAFNFKPSEVGNKALTIQRPHKKEVASQTIKSKSKDHVEESSGMEFEIDNFGLFSGPQNKMMKKDQSLLSITQRDFDTLSDSNVSRSFIFDDDFEVPQKDGKKARSQVRSVSPKRSLRKNINFEEKYVLGKPVIGCYQSLLEPYMWDPSHNPKGWYISEKLDGVRCFWDGNQLWERRGKKINPPEFFLEKFPKSALDGVLWAGRSNYQKCVTTVHNKNPVESEWNELKFIVYDATELIIPFEERLPIMKSFFSDVSSPYLSLHEYEECQGKEHLMQELQKVESLGGDGILLRDPKSIYITDRSKTLLEVRSNEDAVVIKHELDKGKQGKIRVRNGQGVEFEIPLTEAMKKNPPRVGATITYKSRGKTNNGVPKYPSFVKN